MRWTKTWKGHSSEEDPTKDIPEDEIADQHGEHRPVCLIGDH
jgi:hypothetical protein